LIWRHHNLSLKLRNLKSQPIRSRRRIQHNFLEAAWQYDTLLDQTIRRIATVDSGCTQ
jgi:hypothetical protein